MSYISKFSLYSLLLLNLLFIPIACQESPDSTTEIPSGRYSESNGRVSAICVCRGRGKNGSILGKGKTNDQAIENAKLKCDALNSSASNCRIVNP